MIHLFRLSVLLNPHHHLLRTVFTPEFHLKEGSGINEGWINEYLVGFLHELSVIIMTESAILRVAKRPHLDKFLQHMWALIIMFI